jgi:hypothetical protein
MIDPLRFYHFESHFYSKNNNIPISNMFARFNYLLALKKYLLFIMIGLLFDYFLWPSGSLFLGTVIHILMD